MSAYIVSDKTINAIVSFAAAHGVAIVMNGKLTSVAGNEQDVGRFLLQANCNSVNYRYRESDNNTNGYTFEAVTDVPSTDVIGCVRCLDYQSCEVDEWDTTEAYRVLLAIKAAAIRALPGYEKAKTPKDLLQTLLTYATGSKGAGRNTYVYYQGTPSYAVTDGTRWATELARHAPKLASAFRRGFACINAPVVLLKTCDAYEEVAQLSEGYAGSFAQACIEAIRSECERTAAESAPWGLD